MTKEAKKIIACYLLIVMSITIFISCQPESSLGNHDIGAKTINAPTENQQASPSLSPDTESTTLTFLVSADRDIKRFEKVTAAIENDLGIKTVFELRPGGPESVNIIKTRLVSGNMADLCIFNSGALFKMLNPAEYFVDLSDEAFIEEIDDTFKSTVATNGKVYGIPSSISAIAGAWFYNKDIYAQLNLSVPKTWDELISNCEAIKAAGKTAVIGSFKESWTSQMIILADYYNIFAKYPDFAEDFTNNKTSFSDNATALRSFEKLYQINQQGFMNNDFSSTTSQKALEMLANGDGAHYPMLSFQLLSLRSKYSDEINNIGAFGQPGDDSENNGLTVWMPDGIYINNQSKNIDAAKKWCAYFLSEKGIGKNISGSNSTGPFLLKGIKLPDNSYTAIKDLAPYFEDKRTTLALEFQTPLKDPNLPQISQECGSGLETPKESAKKYDDNIEKIAKQLHLPGW